jgi:hypothetical protein
MSSILHKRATVSKSCQIPQNVLQQKLHILLRFSQDVIWRKWQETGKKMHTAELHHILLRKSNKGE